MTPQSLADLLVSSQEQCDHDGVMVKVSRQALDETVAYLRQAAAEVRGGGWQDMATCPKDTDVLLWVDEFQEMSIGYQPADVPAPDCVVVDHTASYADKWQPLPSPPGEAVSGDAEQQARELFAEWHRKKGCGQQVVDDCLSGSIAMPPLCMELLIEALAKREVAYPTGSDREVLLYLMQQFDGETWECARCGHSEDTATMDSAHYLRQYLAKAPTPAVEVTDAIDAERYRWLRDKDSNLDEGFFCGPDELLSGDHLDAAIDAALTASRKGG